jgi:hypothetical protein
MRKPPLWGVEGSPGIPTGNGEVGSECIDRDDAIGPVGNTAIYAAAAADASGTIVKVCIYLDAVEHPENGTGIYFGTFYNTGGSNYKCRDAQLCAVPSVGLNQYNVSLSCESGDYIGWFAYDSVVGESFGIAVDSHENIGNGVVLLANGNHCVVDNEASYSEFGDMDIVSIKGSI